MNTNSTPVATQTASVAATTTKAGPTTSEIAFNWLMFGLSTIVTIGFAYYLISDPSRLDMAWAWIRSLPLLVQLGMWLLFLPWMIALWVWTMPWALAIRLVLVIGILVFSEYLLYPLKP